MVDLKSNPLDQLANAMRSKNLVNCTLIVE